MANDCAVFLATLPPIMTAIKVSGDGGARIQFDVPDTHIADALKVLLWRDGVLEVTVKPAVKNRAEQGHGSQSNDMGQRSKRKPAWTAPESQSIDGDLGAGGGQDGNDQAGGR